jgi:hypothetical protein
VASQKTLKSVVRSLAESFTSLMNYHTDDYVMGRVVRAAWSTRATDFRVNFLIGISNSSPLLVPPVLDAVARDVEWLPDIVRRSHSDLQFVSAAELAVTVDQLRGDRMAISGLESPFTSTVRITDGRVKLYSYSIAGWWYPEKARPRGSRGHGGSFGDVA